MKTPHLRGQAFSLIETAIALGLISCCLAVLLGLMPSALRFNLETQRRAEAARLLKLMATGLQAARWTPSSAQWEILGFDRSSPVAWSADGVPLDPFKGWLKASGMHVAHSGVGDFAYVIDLAPQNASQPASYARAMLRVAWPATAEWTNGKWTRAQGSEETLVIFRPQ